MHCAPPYLLHAHRERAKYQRILFDFAYLKNAEAYDERIDSDNDAVDLDEEFRENHLQLLERFFKMFESVHRFVTDFTTYTQELQEGVFVQHTVESVLMDVEGRQLMCEALYLYGVQLLQLDTLIPGPVRERMIVSYYRYKGAATINNIDEVCKLLRSTGFVPGSGKRPKNYPEEFFARARVPTEVVSMVLGRLRADDVYNHTSAYPSPSHRSTALSTQAAMLYVILYFQPEVLHKETSTMRELVDKHFNDNWIFPFYMGSLVDLSQMWEPYKAAKSALKNVLDKKTVAVMTNHHVGQIRKMETVLAKYLTEGVMVDEYVLTNIRKLLHSVRECNVTLRWFLIHRTTTNKDFKKIIESGCPTDLLLQLMMDTAQFEFELKSMFKRMVDTKAVRWGECKVEAQERMKELAEYFSGTKGLSRGVYKNENLQGWFNSLADEIGALDIENSTVAGRKIAQLIQALEDVQEFHQIETNLQVKQFLMETSQYLTKMIRTVNVNDKVLGDLDIVSDFSYAWEIINEFTAILQQRIKRDPSIAIKLRATFLKLASILSLPLVRITQCNSKDAVSVADYFSSDLVKYVRRVLEVIPRSVFQILDEITNLQTNGMKEVPTKMERQFLKDFAQLDARYTLARATHQVSVFTQGILAMNTTFMGIIKLDPRQLLEDGIRKELVKQNAAAMNSYLEFNTGKVEDFEQRLTALGKKLDGFRQSFEYIQDYINIYGLKIWQEEFSRIINYNVEQESNQFLKKKVFDWQSTYQSDAIPIPRFKRDPKDPSVNFMGRLVREILRQTDPSKTTYVESNQGWFNDKMREVIGIRTFSLLHRGAGIFGLTGMDKLVCFLIVRDLTAFTRLYRRTVTQGVKRFLTRLTQELHPTTQFPVNTGKLYSVAQSKTQKLWPVFLEFVTKIGQAQLIRRQIANELNFSCKLDSKILSCTLEAMNSALINDVSAHYSRPDSKPYPGNPVLPDISQYLETAGINDPLTKIYITSEPLEGIAVLMFLFVLAQTEKLTWSSQMSTLTSSDKKAPLDGAPLVMGVITILRQFHSSHTHTFLAYLGQYVRANIKSSSSSKGSAIPANVTKVLLFLEEFCRFSYTSRKAVDAIVPSYIFDRFQR